MARAVFEGLSMVNAKGSNGHYRSWCKDKNCHPCPIHPHRLESSKTTDDSTYRKSSRRRKRISCLPEVKLMDVGVYKMLTTRHDSIGSSRLVPARVDSTRWKSIGTTGSKTDGCRSVQNVDDSSRLDRVVTTRSSTYRLDSMKVDWNKSQKNLSKPKHGTRHTMYYSFYKRVQTNHTF